MYATMLSPHNIIPHVEVFFFDLNFVPFSKIMFNYFNLTFVLDSL